MNNNLDKFIQRDRRDFDTESPSENVWTNIEKTIPAKKEAKRFSLNELFKWSAAAAIIFIALTSIYFLYIKKYSHETTTVKAETSQEAKPVNQDDISGIAPEYAAEIKKMNQLLANSHSELKSATAGQPELYQQLLKDLNVLDSSYRSLKNQALQSPNRDVIILAMMQNLQLQSELLTRQLMILKEFKNTKQTKNEKAI